MKYLNSKTSLLLGIVASVFLFADVAFAAAAPASQALTTVTTVIQQGITVFIGIIAAVAFVYIAYAVISKFNDARRGRAEWGEVFVPFLAGAVVLVFVTWLVGEAKTASQAIVVT